MEEGGPVLGPLPGATYERGFVIMKPGDMVVFYTDGICETHRGAAGEEEEYGVDRLLEVVRNHQGRPSQEIVDAVFADVEAFAGDAPAEDDRTVVVVAYPQSPADLTATKAFPRPKFV
jgi:sigma-B regulation protein RsbU (phosphoserine phosphatase)